LFVSNIRRWHGDVKPDNILVVDGDFKLADFGFAKFKSRSESEENATIKLRGITTTYGAPEIVNQELQSANPVTQTVDVWSFGTVLLIAATWLALGWKGIEELNFLRTIAISQLLREKSVTLSTTPQNGHAVDPFHDGEKVLPDISHWIRRLELHLRPCDTITKPVLQLVESGMLVNASQRLKSDKLCDDLHSLLEAAEKHERDTQFKTPPSDNIIQAILANDTLRKQHRAHQPINESPTHVEAQFTVTPTGSTSSYSLRFPLSTSRTFSQRIAKSKKITNQILRPEVKPSPQPLIMEEVADKFNVAKPTLQKVAIDVGPRALESKPADDQDRATVGFAVGNDSDTGTQAPVPKSFTQQTGPPGHPSLLKQNTRPFPSSDRDGRPKPPSREISTVARVQSPLRNTVEGPPGLGLPPALKPGFIGPLEAATIKDTSKLLPPDMDIVMDTTRSQKDLSSLPNGTDGTQHMLPMSSTNIDKGKQPIATVSPHTGIGKSPSHTQVPSEDAYQAFKGFSCDLLIERAQMEEDQPKGFLKRFHTESPDIRLAEFVGNRDMVS
jgi:serine/threonine protein kinase